MPDDVPEDAVISDYLSVEEIAAIGQQSYDEFGMTKERAAELYETSKDDVIRVARAIASGGTALFRGPVHGRGRWIGDSTPAVLRASQGSGEGHSATLSVHQCRRGGRFIRSGPVAVAVASGGKGPKFSVTLVGEV